MTKASDNNLDAGSETLTLVDVDAPERTFVADGLVDEGRRFQIVEGRYEATDDACIAKAPRYEADDSDVLAARRETLAREAQFREENLPGLTSSIAQLEVDGESVREGPESVLLYEDAGEETLYDYVLRQPTSGLPPSEGLKIITKIVDWMIDWHERDRVFLDFDPRHILVERGLPVAMVGATNGAEVGAAPDPRELPHREAPYVAPEARQERSGEMRRPLSDIYGIGALLSFILTAQEPTTAVESPLIESAYNDLMNLRPRGIARLVAGTLHPMAKHRAKTLADLRARMDPDDLPDEDAEGFQLVDLPAPWSGAEPPGPNRSVRSDLSPGPLISVGPEMQQQPSGSSAPAGIDQPGVDQRGAAGAPPVDPVEEFSKPEDASVPSPHADAVEHASDADAPPPMDPHPDEYDEIDDDHEIDEDRREVSMIDENLGDRDEPIEPDTPPAEPDSPPMEPSELGKRLPAYEDLPARYRIGFAFGIPLLFVVGAVVLGLLGIL